MGNTNGTNNKIKDFFNDPVFKQIGNGISGTLGKFANFGMTMLDNMMKASTSISSFMSTPYFIYILLAGGGIFVAIRLKLI